MGVSLYIPLEAAGCVIAKVAGLDDDVVTSFVVVVDNYQSHVAVQLHFVRSTHNGQPTPYHPALLLDSRCVS